MGPGGIDKLATTARFSSFEPRFLTEAIHSLPGENKLWFPPVSC